MGTEWATMDTVLPESDLHVSGTMRGPRGTSFWLTQPRPKGVSLDEWEAKRQENWDSIFGKKGE
jgi:hypothetical protein